MIYEGFQCVGQLDRTHRGVKIICSPNFTPPPECGTLPRHCNSGEYMSIEYVNPEGYRHLDPYWT